MTGKIWKTSKIADNITIQEFNNYFAYAIDGILQDLCGFPSMFFYLILGTSFVLHIISLKMVWQQGQGWDTFRNNTDSTA